MFGYEEYPRVPESWRWPLLLAFTALLLGWGMYLMLAISDRPRAWDFGALPDTPAESTYATQEPDLSAPVPEQIHPLPGAKPLDVKGDAK